MLGRHHSEETKQKMSKGNKGKKRSEETKEKIKQSGTLFIKGSVPWNIDLPIEQQPGFGKIPSQEKRKKIGNANSGEKNGMAKLSEKDVENIKRMFLIEKHTQIYIAKIYKVHSSCISNIITGKRRMSKN